MKKAAAEASIQRTKKARMVELFVVRYHVMCTFRCRAPAPAWPTFFPRLVLVPSYVSVWGFCVTTPHQKGGQSEFNSEPAADELAN